MEYIKVSISNNGKNYLYKADFQVENGMIVYVPVKTGEMKTGLVLWSGQIKEEDLPVSKDIIKKAECLCFDNVDNEKALLYFDILIENYKQAMLTKKEIASVSEGIVSLNNLNLQGLVGEFYTKVIPDICLYYVDEPGDEMKKECEFWKALRDWECKLHYGYFYSERLNRRSLKYDPVEESDEYASVELEIERKIRTEIGECRYMGYCHKYWSTKKKMLKEYGIIWKSPAELNPSVIFD